MGLYILVVIDAFPLLLWYSPGVVTMYWWLTPCLRSLGILSGCLWNDATWFAWQWRAEPFGYLTDCGWRSSSPKDGNMQVGGGRDEEVLSAGRDALTA